MRKFPLLLITFTGMRTRFWICPTGNVEDGAMRLVKSIKRVHQKRKR